MSAVEETRQRVELLESLFSHPGWKVFVGDVAEWHAAIAKGWRALRDERGLFWEQGRSEAFEQVLGYEGLTEQIKASLTADVDENLDA